MDDEIPSPEELEYQYMIGEQDEHIEFSLEAEREYSKIMIHEAVVKATAITIICTIAAIIIISFITFCYWLVRN